MSLIGEVVPNTRPYIGGAWVAGDHEIPVIDPTTESSIASVWTASIDDCLAAVEAASDAAPSWAATPPRVRAQVLLRCFDLMVAECDTIAALIQAENGKALREAYGEVAYAAEFFRWFAEETPRIGGEIRVAPNGDKQIVVIPEPVGVAVLITPWNFPAAMATRKLAPALGAGCTCVLKPASETPLTALYLVDLMTRAGVPEGVVNLVLPVPAGPAVEAMIAQPAVRKLSFTGSTEVGKLLLSAAGQHVVRTSMELGGNAPFVVLDDADLDVAIDAAVVAKIRNGGASCIAANRFIVARHVHDEFVDRFAARLRSVKIGYGREPDADLGALVNAGELRKMSNVIGAFVADHATVVCGGRATGGAGYFFEPTVVAEVATDSPALATEIFGPVAPVVAVDSDDEAIAVANDTSSGLIAYVMSRDARRAFAAGRRIDAGMVAVNRGLISDPAAPFGGFKDSGIGKEGGREGIGEYLRQKYVGIDI
jgi:succinate-semialdehyde dehydrogenase/glutarate-semialdehyde dehydrogenase